MIKALFFDLDGTLLPIDMDEFLKGYMHELFTFCAPFSSYDDIKKAIWAGYQYMLTDVTPDTTAEEKFYERFYKVSGLDNSIQPALESFYATKFDIVESFVRERPQAPAIIRLAKQKGYRLILATNPVLPEVALDKRLRWAGLNRNDFEFISQFEEMHFCKPNLQFFTEILEKTGLQACECVMIGNDAQEDLVAQKLGFETFFCTEFGINRDEGEILGAQGGYDELYQYIEALPEVIIK